MDLLPSWCGSQKKSKANKTLKVMLNLLLMGILTNPASANVYSSYSELRNAALNLIGSAKNKITLASDFLSDGEIVSALYIAKYRKITVKVLLGKKFLRHPMSRIRYLRNQKIDYSIQKADFPYPQGSLLVIDDSAYTSNSSFHSRTDSQQINLNKLSISQTKELQAYLAKSNRNPLKDNGKLPVFEVGKSSKRKRQARLANPDHFRSSPKPGSSGSQDDNHYPSIYNYNNHMRNQRRAPKGVPHSLPKSPKYLERFEER